MYSILEQFSLFPIILFSNITWYLIMVILTLILISSSNSFFSKHIIWWYKNFKNLESNTFILLTIWFIILISNIIGMIPYSNTITAQAIIVLSIAIPSFIGINLIGIRLHKLNILYLFLPSGAPNVLIPLITAIEILSYSIRGISLTIRLVANMVAGHILIKLIIYALLSMPLVSVLLIPIIILEFMVAGIQAYVFILLLISYFNDVFIPH